MTSPKRDYELSLNDLCGEAIVVDIFGYATDEFELDTPLFQITRILLSDGRTLSVGGEHDIAFIFGEQGVAVPPEED